MRSPPLLSFHGREDCFQDSKHSGLSTVSHATTRIPPPTSPLCLLRNKQPCRPFGTLLAGRAQGGTLLSLFLWKPRLTQLAPAHEDSPSQSHVMGNVASVRTRALPALRKTLCSALHPGTHTDWLVGLAGRRCEVQAEQRAQFLLYPARVPEEVEPTRPRSGQPSFRDLATLRSLHSKRYLAKFPGFRHTLPRQLHYCKESCFCELV